MGRLKALALHVQEPSATTPATVQQAVLHVARPRECNNATTPFWLRNLGELRTLVNTIADHWQFTPEERAEALRAALNDPESAAACYRDIAAKVRLSPKSATSAVH